MGYLDSCVKNVLARLGLPVRHAIRQLFHKQVSRGPNKPTSLSIWLIWWVVRSWNDIFAVCGRLLELSGIDQGDAKAELPRAYDAWVGVDDGCGQRRLMCFLGVALGRNDVRKQASLERLKTLGKSSYSDYQPRQFA